MSTPEPEPCCPRCGAPFAEDQEYCLECGERLPHPAGVIAVLGKAWRRRLGWYPGDWIWPALAALVIAAAAGAASAIWLADRSSASGRTVVDTAQTATSVQQQTETAPEPPGSTTTPTTTAAAPPPPPPPAPNSLVSWPAGRSGWTIVLDSLPNPSGRAQAYAEARQARRGGLKKVGIIDSSQYSSLHPGYFVVFAGIYANEAEAQGSILDAHQHGYGGAYARRIIP